MFRQGEEIAAILEASTDDGLPLYPTAVILLPRRATKTTAVWSTLIGRCLAHPGYKVVTTAQDGLRARARFHDVRRMLEARDFEGDRRRSARLGVIKKGAGSEAFEFDNGSRIWVVPPEAGAFRGEAADAMLFDEAGELAESRSDDLVGGALPLMDTRPLGQVIIAGTPGRSRSGMLWTFVQRGRDPKDKSVGLVDYSARDTESTTITSEDGEPRLNIKLVRRVHPGIGTLTTLKTIESRFAQMKLAEFEREYLCRFPFDLSVSAISGELWEAARRPFEDLRPRPARVGLAFDVAPDSSSATLAAAWRDETGLAHLEVLACRPGTSWITAAARSAYTKHRTPIAHDTIGANVSPADLLHRARVGLAPMALKSVQGSQSRFVQLLEDAQLVHYSQQDLDLAVLGTAWRTVGDAGRLFGRKDSKNDVSPLVAAALALWQFDQIGPRKPMTIVTSGGRQ